MSEGSLPQLNEQQLADLALAMSRKSQAEKLKTTKGVGKHIIDGDINEFQKVERVRASIDQQFIGEARKKVSGLPQDVVDQVQIARDRDLAFLKSSTSKKK